jgi:hypothetical protein
VEEHYEFLFIQEMRNLTMNVYYLLTIFGAIYEGSSALKLFGTSIVKGKVKLGRLIEAIEAKSEDRVVQGLLEEACVGSRSSVKALKGLTGCFEVQRTLGEPSWTKYAKVLSADDSKNYQIFSSLADNKFVNLSEYRFGCFATASGTYRKSSPGTFEASVTKVSIYLGNVVVNLPVKGTGLISVLISDEFLRAIKSEERAIALQRPIPVPEKYKALLEREEIFV